MSHSKLLGYLDLPAEIRNKIMGFAILPSKFKGFDNPGGHRTGPQPWLHFLTTCKQAYTEGSATLWIGNGFRLQPGPINDTRQWLNKAGIDPSQGVPLRNVAVVLTLLDLLPEMLYSEELYRIYEDRPAARTCLMIGHKVAGDLRPIWEEKIQFLRRMDGIDNVCFWIGDQKLFTRKIHQGFMVKSSMDRSIPLNMSDLLGYA